MIKLSAEEVAKLPNPTTIYHDDDEDYFVGGVEMWHQLHCLVSNKGRHMEKQLLTTHDRIFSESPYGRRSQCGSMERTVQWIQTRSILVSTTP